MHKNIKEKNRFCSIDNVQSMRDIVDFMRKNPDNFGKFKESRTYKLFEPPIFENKKKNHGYFF